MATVIEYIERIWYAMYDLQTVKYVQMIAKQLDRPARWGFIRVSAVRSVLRGLSGAVRQAFSDDP